MSEWIIGLDPGKSGGMAIVNADGEAKTLSFAKATERDIWQWVHGCDLDTVCAYIEKVHAMPKQGVSSTFTFGQSYGFLRGCLIATAIPFEEVSPAKWQGAMKCRTGGDKNVTKAKAQQLFPSIKITHATADALLIAEYGRRLRGGML